MEKRVLNPEKKYWRIFLACLLTAFCILMFCTKSSFLYPLQDWEDDNIIGTVGRGMMNGKVPFRDLYDFKGPAAYFIFGACSLISGRSFIGLFVLEVICFTVFLFYSYKTISLYEEKNAVFCIPVLGMLVASAMSITHGGSLEELSLPFLAYGLYSILYYWKDVYPDRMKPSVLILNGFFAGCMFWAKYTMLGMYFAWIAVLFFAQIIREKVRNAFCSVGWFLLGMLLATVPWIIYYAANGALDKLLQYYFVYNIFGYGGGASRSVTEVLIHIGTCVLATFYRNIQYSVLIAVGVLFFTFFDRKKGMSTVAKISLWLMCVLLCCGIYIGDTGYRYYGVVLAVFTALGFVPILRGFNKITAGKTGKAVSGIAFAAVFLLSVGMSILLTDNRYFLGFKKESVPQLVFADKMQQKKTKESVSLFCYDMMDAGFYLASGSEPGLRCFTKLNNEPEEVREEQLKYLESGRAEFLVTRKEDEYAGYKEIASASYPYEEGISTYYLYQRESAD